LQRVSSAPPERGGLGVAGNSPSRPGSGQRRTAAGLRLGQATFASQLSPGGAGLPTSSSPRTHTQPCPCHSACACHSVPLPSRACHPSRSLSSPQRAAAPPAIRSGWHRGVRERGAHLFARLHTHAPNVSRWRQRRWQWWWRAEG
jgi:hypothetical protein